MPPANSLSGTPARNMMVSPPSTIIEAVPRSGWMRTSAAGTPISTAGGHKALQPLISRAGRSD